MRIEDLDAQWAHQQELEGREKGDVERQVLDEREIQERIRQAAAIMKPVQDHYAKSFEDSDLFTARPAARPTNEEIAKLWVHTMLKRMDLIP